MFQVRKAILALQAIEDNVRRPVNWHFICCWFGHPWQVCSVAATPVSPMFHKGSKQNTACDSSPNDLIWADIRAQKLMLWQWAMIRDSEGRQMPHHIKYQKADPVPKSHRPGDKDDGWMSSWMLYIRDLGEQRMGIGQGTIGWSYTTWTKL